MSDELRAFHSLLITHHSSLMNWFALDVTFDRRAREAVEYALMEAGALGTGSEVGEAAGRIVIRVEPGMAFGTGTHETTRLCLAAIEKHFSGGSFLDVGTGTGILAIAAAKLAPRARVEACDTDALAVRVAEENARLNGVGGRVSFRVGTVGDATASADVTCANLTADVIVPLLPALLGATCGRLILSGILDTQAEQVRARLRALGVSDCEVAQEGEWVSIIV